MPGRDRYDTAITSHRTPNVSAAQLEQVHRRARCTIKRRAADSADAVALLDMLGLLTDERPEYRDELGRVRHPASKDGIDADQWWHGMLAPVPVHFE